MISRGVSPIIRPAPATAAKPTIVDESSPTARLSNTSQTRQNTS
jgi:hypothetical protein